MAGWTQRLESLRSWDGLKRVLRNFAWLMFDRIFMAALGGVVAVLVARALGPLHFGELSYAFSFVGLFMPLVALGVDPILTRELVKRPTDSARLLGSALGIKLSGGLVAVLVAVGTIAVVRRDDPTVQLLVVVTSLMLLPAAIPIPAWYAARVESKYTVLSRLVGRLVMAAGRVALVVVHGPLLLFAGMYAVYELVTLITAALFYRRQGNRVTLWRFDLTEAKLIARQAWPVFLGSIGAQMTYKIDQVMLGEMAGDVVVGQYGAALQLVNVFYSAALAVTISVFPTIVQLNKESGEKYERRMQQLHSGLVWTALAGAAVTALVAGPVTGLLYGPGFEASAELLVLLVFSCVFSFPAAAQTSWVYAEGLQMYWQATVLGGVLVNVVANYLLIPLHGAAGACIATIASQFCGAILFPAIVRPLRPSAIHTLRAFALPWTLLSGMVSKRT